MKTILNLALLEAVLILILEMKLSDFDYVLPDELIAKYPPTDRPSARLLCAERSSGRLTHKVFRDILHELKSGDLLVLNDTKVLPARLFGHKQSGGEVEILLVKQLSEREWQVLLRPGRRVRKGMVLTLGGNGIEIQACVLDDAKDGTAGRIVEFLDDSFRKHLETIGHMPLPPYIAREDEEGDKEWYQTVFARRDGACAAPTAGLHFDRELLAKLEGIGVEIVYVTLHVGYGTFQTIQAENLDEHKMFEEEFELSPEAASKINEAKLAGRRVIACGTTVVRTLESSAVKKGEVKPQRGATRLFVYPPYEFKIVDGLITNFHLPKSSLLLLVGAFLGYDKMRAAYDEAVRERYKFYSYGDAMLIL